MKDSRTLFSRLAIGGDTATATYTPTSPSQYVIYAAPTGEVIVVGIDGGTEVWDIWYPSSHGGKPNRSVKHAIVYSIETGLAVAQDGSIYVPFISTATKKQEYEEISPGHSKPTRTIVESIVPPGVSYYDRDSAVAPDGTLYVGEFAYDGDPYAGLYVYPPSAPERYVSNGAPAPTGLDLDAAGNVYVANSSSRTTASGGWTRDKYHLLSVYAPGGTSLLRQVNRGFNNPRYLAVDDDGTAYLLEFPQFNPAVEDVAVVRSAADVGSVLYKLPLWGFSDSLELYNGVRAKPLARLR